MARSQPARLRELAIPSFPRSKTQRRSPGFACRCHTIGWRLRINPACESSARGTPRRPPTDRARGGRPGHAGALGRAVRNDRGRNVGACAGYRDRLRQTDMWVVVVDIYVAYFGVDGRFRHPWFGKGFPESPSS